MTGPEDRPGAVDRGRLRAAHADREQVIGTLKIAFTDGRLTKDELDAPRAIRQVQMMYRIGDSGRRLNP